MSGFSKLIYRFHVIPIKIPARYFGAIDKVIIKFVSIGKRPRIDNTVLKEKKKV